jgi:hypothetical protein
MDRIIKYIDRDNLDYKRTFATTASINIHPHDNVSIDFSEEFFNPVVVIERGLTDEDHLVHSRDRNLLEVIRERKCSVVMNKKQALNMAQWILDNVDEEE